MPKPRNILRRSFESALKSHYVNKLVNTAKRSPVSLVCMFLWKPYQLLSTYGSVAVCPRKRQVASFHREMDLGYILTTLRRKNNVQIPMFSWTNSLPAWLSQQLKVSLRVSWSAVQEVTIAMLRQYFGLLVITALVLHCTFWTRVH